MEAVPDGATDVLDLSGHWVMPGFVDMHTHVGLDGAPSLAPAESAAFVALVGYRNALAMLQSGFTTIRNVGTRGYATTELARAIDAGILEGPNIFDAGKFIAPHGIKPSVTRAGIAHPIPEEAGEIWKSSHIYATGPWELIDAVRRNVYHGARVIKLYLDQNPYTFRLEELRAAVEEAHSAGVTVAAHVGLGGEAARRAILAGVDTIEHGFELDREVLELMKEHGTALVTTDFPRALILEMFSGREEAALTWREKYTKRLKLAYEIGTPILFGTDAIMQLPGRNRGEMAISFIDQWLDCGIAPADLLRAMTVDAYRSIGQDQKRGAVSGGYVADLVILAGNPLKDPGVLKAPVAVLKDGRFVQGDHLRGAADWEGAANDDG
jgi:imidazolonepropionase-like amidohydrolase